MHYKAFASDVTSDVQIENCSWFFSVNDFAHFVLFCAT